MGQGRGWREAPCSGPKEEESTRKPPSWDRGVRGAESARSVARRKLPRGPCEPTGAPPAETGRAQGQLFPLKCLVSPWADSMPTRRGLGRARGGGASSGGQALLPGQPGALPSIAGSAALPLPRKSPAEQQLPGAPSCCCQTQGPQPKKALKRRGQGRDTASHPKQKWLGTSPKTCKRRAVPSKLPQGPRGAGAFPHLPQDPGGAGSPHLPETPEEQAVPPPSLRPPRSRHSLTFPKTPEEWAVPPHLLPDPLGEGQSLPTFPETPKEWVVPHLL